MGNQEIHTAARELPKTNINTAMAGSYNEIYKDFLAQYLSFRGGKLAAGENALNKLLTAYYTLPATLHIQRDEQESIRFVESVDLFVSDLAAYASTSQHPTKEHILRMDGIVRSFLKIMYKLGYSV